MKVMTWKILSIQNRSELTNTSDERKNTRITIWSKDVENT